MSKEHQIYRGSTIRFENGDRVIHKEHGRGTVDCDTLYALGFYFVGFDHGLVARCLKEDLTLDGEGQ